jgi:methionyl-tRNA formyltransferase
VDNGDGLQTISDIGFAIQVRAFAGWPGTNANFKVVSSDGSQVVQETFKILKTRMGFSENHSESGRVPMLTMFEKDLVVHCGKEGEPGGCLEILELQPVGKRAMQVGAYLNGLNGRQLRLPLE